MAMSQPSRSASAAKLLQLHVREDWKDGSSEDATSTSLTFGIKRQAQIPR